MQLQKQLAENEGGVEDDREGAQKDCDQRARQMEIIYVFYKSHEKYLLGL